MRPFLIIPIVVIIAFAGIYFLKSLTGDALSAAIVALTLFVTVAAWLAGPFAAVGRPVSRY